MTLGFYHERASRLGIDPALVVPTLDGTSILVHSDAPEYGLPVHVTGSAAAQEVSDRCYDVFTTTFPLLHEAAEQIWPDSQDHTQGDLGAIDKRALQSIVSVGLRPPKLQTGKIFNIHLEAVAPASLSPSLRKMTAAGRSRETIEVHPDAEACFVISAAVRSGHDTRPVACVAVFALERALLSARLPRADRNMSEYGVRRRIFLKAASVRDPLVAGGALERHNTESYRDPWHLTSRPQLVLPFTFSIPKASGGNPPEDFAL